MVVVKWPVDVEGQRVKLDGLMCACVYKEDDGSIVTSSGTYTYSNMNCFTWSRKYNE